MTIANTRKGLPALFRAGIPAKSARKDSPARFRAGITAKSARKDLQRSFYNGILVARSGLYRGSFGWEGEIGVRKLRE